MSKNKSRTPNPGSRIMTMNMITICNGKWEMFGITITQDLCTTIPTVMGRKVGSDTLTAKIYIYQLEF